MNTIAAAALLAGSALVSFAQQDGAQPKSLPVYRIQLTLRDSEVGQQPTVRKFMMVIEEKEWARLKTGSKIPILDGAESVQLCRRRNKHNVPDVRTRRSGEDRLRD